MGATLSLVFANAKHQRWRLALAALAIVAASTSVVWVVSGYDALSAQFAAFSGGALGRYDAIVTPQVAAHPVPGSVSQPPLDSGLIAELRADPAVAEVAPAAQIMATLDLPVHVYRKGAPGAEARDPNAPTIAAPGSLPAGAEPQRIVAKFFDIPSLVSTAAAAPPYDLVQGRWLAAGDAREGVLTRDGARAVQAEVGDTLVVASNQGDVELQLVGLVEGPRIESSPGEGTSGPANSALYLRDALLTEVAGRPCPPTLALLAFAEGTDVGAFRARWEPRLAEFDPPVVFGALSEIAESLDETWAGGEAKAQAQAATAMALLAALFIIFATCSMGVSEGQRELAMLRAIGLSRAQLAGVVLGEALLLGLVGWLGGLAAGYTLLSLLGAAPAGGVVLGPATLALAGVAAGGGALLAAVIPAIRAALLSPLEGLAPPAAAQQRRWLPYAALAGLGLVSVGPLLLTAAPIAPAQRPFAYSLVGVPALALGLLLLTPVLVVVVERALSGITARLLAVDPELLQSQLSSNLGRTVGTTLALSVGLMLYVALHAWGISMLQPFLPGRWAPDAVVSFMSGGLQEEGVEALRRAPGVVAEQTFPLAVEQPLLDGDPLNAAQGRRIVEQDNVIVVGIDPAAFEGASPALELDMVAGRADQAAQALRAGRGCIVPAHFARQAGLSLGDTFRVLPPAPGAEPLTYEVAGIATLQGWHWLTKFSGLRRRRVRAGALVFAGFDRVRRDFDLPRVNYVWTRLQPGVTDEDLAKTLLPLAERNLGERVPVNGQGTWAKRSLTAGNSLRITTSTRIAGLITGVTKRVLSGMSRIPLITLLFSALAVINTMLAAVRARRWEFGVLRALGVTRAALVRLILAESALVGLTACSLGLSAGLLAGWCGTGASQQGTFGGLEVSLVLPWRQLLPVLGLTVLLCLLAGLWPALRAGRADPLTLLQAGRGGARG